MTVQEKAGGKLPPVWREPMRARLAGEDVHSARWRRLFGPNREDGLLDIGPGADQGLKRAKGGCLTDMSQSGHRLEDTKFENTGHDRVKTRIRCSDETYKPLSTLCMKAPKSLVPAGPSRRPTSYDVARLAGVSQSAVSRCFRTGSSISPDKKKAIQKAAAKLGYQPNAIASGLITKRSNLVAVLISNLTNLYYPEVLAELTHRLTEKGVRVLLFALQSESDVDAALDQIWRYRVDGAISAARLSAMQLRAFERHRVPVVLYNRFAEGEPVPSVSCDSIGGERLLVDRLVKAGHRIFGIIAGPEDSFVGNQRVAGAYDRLAGHGLKARIVRGAFDHDSGAAALRELMSAPVKPDAVICANDLMGIGAIDAARHAFGLSLPEDLSVVGFDGVGPAAWPSYRLTTIRQPVRRMTDAAVTMLLERVEDPSLPHESRSFAGALIEGGSARI